MIYNISDLNVATELKDSFDERCRKCLAIIDSSTGKSVYSGAM